MSKSCQALNRGFLGPPSLPLPPARPFIQGVQLFWDYRVSKSKSPRSEARELLHSRIRAGSSPASAKSPQSQGTCPPVSLGLLVHAVRRRQPRVPTLRPKHLVGSTLSSRSRSSRSSSLPSSYPLPLPNVLRPVLPRPVRKASAPDVPAMLRMRARCSRSTLHPGLCTRGV